MKNIWNKLTELERVEYITLTLYVGIVLLVLI